MGASFETVAVIGGGTMGSGIAALSASRGCRVILLDITKDHADQAVARMTQGRSPMLDDASIAAKIETGSIDEDLSIIGDADWVCEAIIEDLATKQALFKRIEPLRREGSVVSTNTSGIPLRDITEGMSARLCQDIAVTHFFNPVKVMKLLEIIPGAQTRPEVVSRLADFCGDTLEKGVVHAKDTVNFIGNRIGCFWMLSGLHKARKARLDGGLSMETIDALMQAPVGLPSTGLYGLIDLIGLDIMDFVGKNLEINLPADDIGREFTSFPAEEAAMLERGQLGRKSGAGFYRMLKNEDGSRLRETFDLDAGDWRGSEKVALREELTSISTLMFDPSPEGRFAWDLMGGTLLYAADLVPEIADDIVNIDRAMRWGFSWRFGPFQLLDEMGPERVIARLEAEGRPVPRMLQVLKASQVPTFYTADGGGFLSTDGSYAFIT